VKKKKAQIDILRVDIENNESILKDSEEFTCVHDDDLTALANFRSAVGLRHSSILEDNTSPITENKYNQIMYRSDRSQIITYDNICLSKDQVISQNSQVSSPKLEKESFSQKLTFATSLLSSTNCSLSPLYEEDEYNLHDNDKKCNSNQIRSISRLSSFERSSKMVKIA